MFSFGTGHLNKQHRAKLSEIYSKRKRTEYSKKKTSETLKEYYKNYKQVITPEAIVKMKETKAKNPTGTGRWMNNGCLQKKPLLIFLSSVVMKS